MQCLHPFCPRGTGLATWADVVNNPLLVARAADRPGLLAALQAGFNLAPSNPPAPAVPPTTRLALLRRLLQLCPCLANQIDLPPSPRAVVHLCELTLGQRIDQSNVNTAFAIQHPHAPGFLFPPARMPKAGGTIMEMLCSEVLASAGIPAMGLDGAGWPVWNMPGHILLNEGKMAGLQAFGDLLVPCGPTNLVISVKSEAARERLLYSSNAIEGIGFGFFNDPSEFWTVERMTLYKRMGFSAIYMPDATHAALMSQLSLRGTAGRAVNVNGTALYRPHSVFGHDMRRVVGKSSFLL